MIQASNWNIPGCVIAIRYVGCGKRSSPDDAAIKCRKNRLPIERCRIEDPQLMCMGVKRLDAAHTRRFHRRASS